MGEKVCTSVWVPKPGVLTSVACVKPSSPVLRSPPYWVPRMVDGEAGAGAGGAAPSAVANSLSATRTSRKHPEVTCGGQYGVNGWSRGGTRGWRVGMGAKTAHPGGRKHAPDRDSPARVSAARGRSNRPGRPRYARGCVGPLSPGRRGVCAWV